MYVQTNVTQIKQMFTLSQINALSQEQYTYKIQHLYNDQSSL